MNHLNNIMSVVMNYYFKFNHKFVSRDEFFISSLSNEQINLSFRITSISEIQFQVR